MITSGDGESEAQASSTVSLGPTTTTTTIRATTTTTAPQTTTSEGTTTTTFDARAEIQAFVVVFAEAIANSDIDLLFGTLHPAVLERYEAEVCRTFIEDEILLLEDYRLTGDLQGPTTETIGSFTYEAYVGPVTFGFRGEDFESTAKFAIDDGVRWFTECR